MFTKSIILLSITLFNINLLIAASSGWISGGGEIIKDSRNPWFIQNTKTVYYCIKIDEKKFSLPLYQAKTRIEQAIKYWQDEFASSVKITGGLPEPIQVATQEFILEQCQKSTDLIIQLGVLDHEQQLFLENGSTTYASIAVRTEYDRKQMKGKGFIYIAPDVDSKCGISKPIKNRCYNDSPFYNNSINENVWSKADGSILYAITAHELGHVFGLTHAGGTSLDDIMSDRYVESLLKIDEILEPSVVASQINKYGLPAYFKFTEFPKYGQAHSVNQMFRDFFQIPKKFNGYFFERVLNTNQFNLWGITNYYDVLSNHGEIDFNKFHIEIIGSGIFKRNDLLRDLNTMVRVWIPKEQEVFELNDNLIYNPVEGPNKYKYSYFTGTYKSLQGNIITREIYFRVTPGSNLLVIGGVKDGKLILDLDLWVK